MRHFIYDLILYKSIGYIYILYINIYLLLLFFASVREQSAVRGRELLSGREGKGDVISLKVPFKGGS